MPEAACSPVRKLLQDCNQTIPKSHRYITTSSDCIPTLVNMRCAFVVRLGSRSKPSEGRFEGCVEEVDSGKELRFRSAEELLQFLGNCFEIIQASQAKHQTGKTEQNSDEC